MLKDIVLLHPILGFPRFREHCRFLKQLLSQEGRFWDNPSFPFRKHSQCLEFDRCIASCLLLSVVTFSIIGSRSSPGVFVYPECFCSVVDIGWRRCSTFVHPWVTAVWKHLLIPLCNWDHWIIIPGHNRFIQWIHYLEVRCACPSGSNCICASIVGPGIAPGTWYQFVCIRIGTHSTTIIITWRQSDVLLIIFALAPKFSILIWSFSTGQDPRIYLVIPGLPFAWCPLRLSIQP